MTDAQRAAMLNAKSWGERVLSETISEPRLKATLLFEAIERYKITPAIYARLLGLDAASFAAFLDTKIAPGEVFYMDAASGTLAAPYLAFAKVRRQLKAEKAAFNVVYRGAMNDDFLTALLAVLLTQNGITNILDFQARNFTFSFPAGTPLIPEYVNIGDATGRSGRYLYPIDIDKSDYENPPVYWVDPSLYSESLVDGNPAAFLNSAQTVDSGIVDYYYNKQTGQRLDVFDGYRGRSIYYDETGNGTTIFNVKFTPEGIPVFLAQLAYNESLLQQFVPVLGIIAMAATAGGAAPWLGSSVLGAEVAAAYPAIADGLGKLIISTVATGGDVAGSAQKLASTLAGGYFGDVLGTGLGSEAIGTLAGAAATAALSGDDVLMAVGQSAISLGLKMDFGYDDAVPFDDSGTFVDPDFGSDPVYPDAGQFADLTSLADIGIDPNGFAFSEWMVSSEDILFDQGLSLDALAVDASGNLFFADGQYVEMSPDVYADSFYADDAGNIRSPDNAVILSASDAQSMNDEQIAGAIYQDWQSKQGAVVGSQQAPNGRPDVIPPAASQTKIPTMLDYVAAFDKLLGTAAGIYSKIRAIGNGTYSSLPSVYPGGIPRVQAVGVPVAQADGSTITNNGNGTQTIRRPNGTTDTIRTTYSGVSNAGGFLAGVSTQTLLIGGAVLLGALLISKRR